jgi:hypothetical protein
MRVVIQLGGGGKRCAQISQVSEHPQLGDACFVERDALGDGTTGERETA